MEQIELNKILKAHRRWLDGKAGGERADLAGANLERANLPAPTMLLFANWGEVSDELCVELMRYDASNHPEPERFTDWARGGECPYNGTYWQRAANFHEKRELWKAGASKSALELVMPLFNEKNIKR